VFDTLLHVLLLDRQLCCIARHCRLRRLPTEKTRDETAERPLQEGTEDAIQLNDRACLDSESYPTDTASNASAPARPRSLARPVNALSFFFLLYSTLDTRRIHRSTGWDSRYDRASADLDPIPAVRPGLTAIAAPAAGSGSDCRAHHPPNSDKTSRLHAPQRGRSEAMESYAMMAEGYVASLAVEARAHEQVQSQFWVGTTAPFRPGRTRHIFALRPASVTCFAATYTASTSAPA